jgi:hypothetical protein
MLEFPGLPVRNRHRRERQVEGRSIREFSISRVALESRSQSPEQEF